jgi:hypothetical protein
VILFLAIFPLENYDFHISKGDFHGKNGPNFVDIEKKNPYHWIFMRSSSR